MNFRRVWQMPSSDTFDIPAIGALVRRYLSGVSVDPFARDKRWATHTNDLNPATQAEHHMQAVDFLNMLADQGVVADVILFDPPYSPRQIAECYAIAGLETDMGSTQNAKLYADCRKAIRRLSRPGTRVLSFGWNSSGMGSGYETEEMLLVCHGGAHNDTICMVERMVEQQAELIEDQQPAKDKCHTCGGTGTVTTGSFNKLISCPSCGLTRAQKWARGVLA